MSNIIFGFESPKQPVVYITGDNYIQGTAIDKLVCIIEQDFARQIKSFLEENQTLTSQDVDYMLSSNQLLRELKDQENKYYIGETK